MVIIWEWFWILKCKDFKNDRPFDWLYDATPRQITEFAKSMYEDAWGLRWRIEERIDGLMKRESA